MRRILAIVPLVVVSVLFPMTPARAATCSKVSASGALESDFDGDAYSDLAVGVPFEDFENIDNGGAVHVFYGSSSGVSTRDQVFTQDTPGIPGDGELDDQFGWSLTTGDFDGDGYCDLAVGARSEDIGTVGGTNAGAVYVIYGSSSGLIPEGTQVFHQNTPGIKGTAEDTDQFGWSLVAADFGEGSQADLAIGAPKENVGAISNAGSVHILYGSSTGITTSGDQVFHQDTAGIEGSAEVNDYFGYSLTAGNLGDGSEADLVVGVPYEGIGALTDAGAVQVIYGSGTGLTTSGDQAWNLTSSGVQGVASAGDFFGNGLAVGNFGKGSTGDLAIGAPYAEAGGATDAGQIHVLYGTSTGVSATGDEVFDEDVLGIGGGAQASDHFGYTLAAANLGDSSEADLAVRVSEQDVAGDADAGAVDVIYGASAGGLGLSGTQQFTQDTGGVEDTGEPGDFFGSPGIFAADFGNGAHADLAIGVQSESLAAADCGAVAVLYGTSTGIEVTDDELIHEDLDGVIGQSETSDSFGTVSVGSI